jgi:hypothetical protein
MASPEREATESALPKPRTVIEIGATLLAGGFTLCTRAIDQVRLRSDNASLLYYYHLTCSYGNSRPMRSRCSE